MRLLLGVGLSVAVAAGGLNAASPGLLQSGRYEVQVRLILPNLDDMTATKTVQVCLSSGDTNRNRGLKVLSDNNPLARCPIDNVRADGAELTFDIRCTGGNAARGWARYSLTSSGFIGRITMKMGGKNMTMTETQIGRRVGACRPEGT